MVNGLLFPIFTCSSSSDGGDSSGGNGVRGGSGGGNGVRDGIRTRACWFPAMGTEANSNATAAMAKVLNVMVAFEFIVSISAYFSKDKS
jgi:hypothetical protein